MALDAQAVALVINNGDSMVVTRVHPDDKHKKLKRLFKKDLEGKEFSMKKNAGNPFAISVTMVNPIFYIGEEGLRDFFSNCFSQPDPEVVSHP